MVITLDQLEQSKVYLGKSDLTKFAHPLEYFQPFMDTLSETEGVEFEVQVEGETKNAERGSDIENISYARVAVTARMPKSFDVLADVFGFDHLYKQMGMVYAFDTAKPEMKVYRGNRVSVCTNQCVFGADNVTSVLMLNSSIETLYDQTKRYADTAMGESVKYKRIIEHLANAEMNRSQLLEHIGEIVWFARKEKKAGITTANDLVLYLQDEKSKYHVDENSVTNKWLTYNAITESLKKSSIMEEVSKTLLFSDLFIKDKTLLA